MCGVLLVMIPPKAWERLEVAPGSKELQVNDWARARSLTRPAWVSPRCGAGMRGIALATLALGMAPGEVAEFAAAVEVVGTKDVVYPTLTPAGRNPSRFPKDTYILVYSQHPSKRPQLP